MAQNQNAKAVIVFSTSYLPLASGAELAVKEITDHVQDFDFFLLTCRMSRAYPRHERIGNVEVRRLGVGIPFLDKLTAPLLGAQEARRIMRTRPIYAFWSVMVSYMTLAPFLLKRLGLHRGIPILLTLQEGDSEYHLRHARGGLIGLSWRFTLRHVARVHAISEYLAHLARSFGYMGEIVLIPNGVATDVFVPREHHPFGHTVVTTSRLVKKNGIDILVRAIAEVKKRYPNVLCCIIGDGIERPHLEAIVRDLDLSSAVIFQGSLPFESIPAELAAADVFVRPSRSEGLGTSFLEAMAVGLPIVATKVGGIEDFLMDGVTGLYVHVEDPHDVAQKIIMLFEDEKLRESLIASSRKLIVEKYSWDSVADRMRELLKNL